MTGRKRALSYLKEQRRRIFLYLAILGIFMLVTALYGLPMEPVLYAALLWGAAGLAALLWGGLEYVKKVKALEQIRENLICERENLPRARGEQERLYQEIVCGLWETLQKDRAAQEQAYTELEEYYTTWVHQIKTPIAALRLLQQSEGGKEASAMELFKIEQYVELALNYLRTQDMSRDLQIKECSLDAIVRQLVKKYSRMFILKNLSLDYKTISCTVLSDEKWLSFILEQLLSNSLKYTKTGGISIYMEPEREKVLVIQDTGIGISREDLPRIFEKGFTGANGRADKKATGIGLYSAKKAASYLGHTITVESFPGKGTKVYLDLSSTELEVF